jgi:hypothetical protein
MSTSLKCSKAPPTNWKDDTTCHHVISKLEMQQGMIATHILKSQGQALSASLQM